MQSVLALLLLQHGRHHLRGGLGGQGPDRHLPPGARLHARGGGTVGGEEEGRGGGREEEGCRRRS